MIRWELMESWREVLREAGLASFESLWNLKKVPFKRKKDREILRLELGERVFFLKRYFRLSWRERFFTWAEREWQAARTLAAEGFGVPEPVAMGVEVLLGWRKRALSLFREAPGKRLEDLLRENPSLVSEILEPLAETAARFHALGFSHQDFYLCHLFWDGQRIYLIDLQRVRRSRPPKTSWIIKDIAELFYSAREILGTYARDFEKDFLKLYARQHPWLLSEKGLTKLEKKVRRIARHDARLKARRKSPKA